MAGHRAGRHPTTYGVVLVALVTLQAFAGFADRNRGQIIQSGRLVAYALLTTVLTVAVLALVTRRWGGTDPNRLALVVGVVVASFFGFGAIFDPNPRDTSWLVAELAVWTVLTLLVARLAHLAGGNPNVRVAVVTFAAVMFAVPAVSYGTYVVGREPLIEIEDPGTLAVPVDRPNVYWMLLDSYDRPDVMAEVADVDIGPFVESLEAHGLQVSSSSRTSYPRTNLSVASTLQMDYVLEPGHDVADDFARFGPVVVGHNRTTARFEALGYQTIYGAAGGVEWSACRRDLVDVCLPLIRPSPATGELEKALLDLTPLGTVSLPIPYSDPASFVDGLADPDLGVEAPFFAFQHILAPHFPYRYRDDCSTRSVPLDERPMDPHERLVAYRTQVQCLNGEVLDAVRRIVERDPTAVIVIQSDHGSEIRWRWTERPYDWTPDQVTERYSVFNAMRLPEMCRSNIEGAALVNTFRIVFACIEGREPDLLDYRAFALPIDDVSALTELGPDRFER